MKYELTIASTNLAGTKPVFAIRAIRAITGLGLKDVKDIIDALKKSPGRSIFELHQPPTAQQIADLYEAGYTLTRSVDGSSLVAGVRELAIQAINAREYAMCHRLLAILEEADNN